MTDDDLRKLSAQITTAYVGNNPVQRSEVAELVSSVAGAINALFNPPPPQRSSLVPRVSVKKSITPDYLISLEDGKPYRTLKRHLSVRGLTPDEYRAKWGLPADYPIVAPNYSKERSAQAKALGLGRKPKATKRGRSVKK